MNSIRQIRELNQRELENNVSPEASWHTDYRDTAFIYIGGLPYELSEGDVVTIFSQYGEPTYINLIRDKETGKSKGFAFLKYEDQRSTDLAVDNLGGAVVMGRTLKVDHTRYKKKDDEPEEGHNLTNEYKNSEEEAEEGRRKRRRTSESEGREERPMIKEEIELAKLIENHDDEDPMKQYLVHEKREKVALALAALKGSKKPEKLHKDRHRHRSRKEDRDESKFSRYRDEDRRRRRSRSRDKFSATGPDSKTHSGRSNHGGRRMDDDKNQKPRRREILDRSGHERDHQELRIDRDNNSNDRTRSRRVS